MVNNTWTFNVVCGIHSHELCFKLVGHPIACFHNPEDKDIASDMTLNMVLPKNILATLKQKIPQNIITNKYTIFMPETTR